MCGVSGVGGAGGVTPPMVMTGSAPKGTGSVQQDPVEKAAHTAATADAATGTTAGGPSQVIQGVGELNSALLPLLKQLTELVQQLMSALASSGYNHAESGAAQAAGRYRG